MQKWSYKRAEVGVGNLIYVVDGTAARPARQTVDSYLMEVGAEGWELTGVAGTDSSAVHTLYFKRPKQ
jgi:hypothetical protein